jgi:hypothetical protein
LAAPRSVAIVIASLVLCATAQAGDVPTAADRYSIAGPVSDPPQSLTLLDESWLVPPVEALGTSAAVTDQSARSEEILDGHGPVLSRPLREPVPGGGPLSYSLSDRLTAQLLYRHSQPFDRSASKALREDSSTALSTRPDRDVLDLNMSWLLAGSSVGVGYQLQSARGTSLADTVSVSRFLPGSEQAMHSFTLGLTRKWGAAAPPPLVELPLLLPDLDIAATETTPTPAP